MSDFQSNLLKQILYLQNLKQEGGFWDFKKKWHQKNLSLLHDIICMANNLENRDAYIIIGVDESEDYTFCDVTHDPNRRNTQQLVDFLKDKKFAGGIRPTVYVQSLFIPECHVTIDVIVIQNSHQTPFYLSTHYQELRAHHIYTRIQNTNTPKDSSADIDKVEQLWRKRFHLDESPTQRFLYYLQDIENWEITYDSNEDLIYFYRYAPEFTIRQIPQDDRKAFQYFLFMQEDPTPYYKEVTLYYHQTPIRHFSGIYLNNASCFVISPNRSTIQFSQCTKQDITSAENTIYYRYYVQGTFEFLLTKLFQDSQSPDTFQAHINSVLFFETDHERIQFEEYVSLHKREYLTLFNKQYPSLLYPEYYDGKTDSFDKQFKDKQILDIMLENFLKCPEKKSG